MILLSSYSIPSFRIYIVQILIPPLYDILIHQLSVMPTVHCTNKKTYQKLRYASRLPKDPLLDGSQLHPETRNRNGNGNRPNESLLNNNSSHGGDRSSTPIMSNETSASIHNGRITNVSHVDDRTLQLCVHMGVAFNTSEGEHNQHFSAVTNANWSHGHGVQSHETLPHSHPSSRPPLVAAAAGVSNLKRKSDELIYVKVGRKEEYEAFELENPENPGENNTVWVEWVISGKKQCIFRHQIVKDGLRARKRQRPAKFSLIE